MSGVGRSKGTVAGADNFDKFAWQRQLLSARLGPTATAVGLALSSFASLDGGNVRPSLSGLADGARIDRRTMSRHVAELVRLGVLSVVAAPLGRPVEYRLVSFGAAGVPLNDGEEAEGDREDVWTLEGPVGCGTEPQGGAAQSPGGCGTEPHNQSGPDMDQSPLSDISLTGPLELDDPWSPGERADREAPPFLRQPHAFEPEPDDEPASYVTARRRRDEAPRRYRPAWADQ